MKLLAGWGVFGVLALGSAVGCGQASEDAGDVDEAVAVAALQQGGDGSDEQIADSVEAAPVLDRECHFSDIRKQLRATYDLNHDGKLDDDERSSLHEDFGGPVRRAARRHAAREVRRGWLKQVYDADDSGSLDESERAELRADLDARCEQRMAALIEKFDANADGELAAAEWTAAREELAARFASKRAELLAEFDKNHDGKLGPAERSAALLGLHDRIELRWKSVEKQHDANHDDKLDATEKAALRDATKSKLRGEHTS